MLEDVLIQSQALPGCGVFLIGFVTHSASSTFYRSVYFPKKIRINTFQAAGNQEENGIPALLVAPTKTTKKRNNLDFIHEFNKRLIFIYGA